MSPVQIGDATLYNGDCLEGMAGLPDGCVDMVLTDPPFSSGTRREAGKSMRPAMIRSAKGGDWFGSDNLTTDGFSYLMRQCALEWHRLLKKGGHLLCFIDWRMMSALSNAIESADFRKVNLIVWDKTYFGMGSFFRNQHELVLHFTKDKSDPPHKRDTANVIQAKPIRGGLHPTEKPTDLLEKLISVTSKEKETILDTFFGGCSTGLAALNTNRKFIGIEREPKYFNIAQARILDAYIKAQI